MATTAVAEETAASRHMPTPGSDALPPPDSESPTTTAPANDGS
ncbi:MAG TPA: hypothetical protein VFJ07_13965 [Streptosporangiaceae bacterium]|nr:hypothetical protein [Streptosporangiaceae bacterium]